MAIALLSMTGAPGGTPYADGLPVVHMPCKGALLSSVAMGEWES